MQTRTFLKSITITVLITGILLTGVKAEGISLQDIENTLPLLPEATILYSKKNNHNNDHIACACSVNKKMAAVMISNLPTK